MKRNYFFCLLLTLLIPSGLYAQSREVVDLNEGWSYKPISDGTRNAPQIQVTLPHTWNVDYIEGTHDYSRTAMAYYRKLEVTPQMQGRRLFLYFEGVNSVATVFVNRKTVGEHKGGYTAFCFEITDMVTPGENTLELWISNAFRTDVLPLTGDFNIYGGIHRPVHLIITSEDCIDPAFYASQGVFIHQKSVSKDSAEIEVETLLSLKGESSDLTLRASVIDSDGQVVASSEQAAQAPRTGIPFNIAKPRLWNARKDPYLYRVQVELLRDGQTIDSVTQPLGLRYFHVNPDEGFFLNGEYYDLHGVNRHEDVKGHGSALTREEYLKDVDLLNELNATMVRLAHYPHGEPIYNLCDSTGIVLWSEIPLVGPGGYRYAGYLKSIEENATLALKELIYQKYNHPSVIFWGLFNELIIDSTGGYFSEYDNPVAFVKELNELCHSLDPYRLTTFATCVDQEHFLGCSDLIAWNRYYSWDASASAAEFLDKSKIGALGQPIGVSEYGRGGSLTHHADPTHKEEYNFTEDYHPEEYQAVCHEEYWRVLASRPYIWEKTLWQFADFQSAIREEGDTPGLNDKGLVSYDRQTKKDVFYFYKANWNDTPMLHLCSKRFSRREFSTTEVKAYTNLKEATLYVNGEKVSTKAPDEVKLIRWEGIELLPGENSIVVKAGKGKDALEDSCVWTLE